MIVGAGSEGPSGGGRAYVFSGRDGSLLVELSSPNPEEIGNFGWAVSGAGDVDRDGAQDLLVGAPQENPGTSPVDAGRAYVFSGVDGSLLFELMSADEHRYEGYDRRFGYSVPGVGDVNQDGFADLIVGTVYDRPNVFLSAPSVVRINSGGPVLVDASGRLFVADRPYAAGSYGHVGGQRLRFRHSIGGTGDDLLYRDLRIARDGEFSYRFDLPANSPLEVTLFLMAPIPESGGNIVFDVLAEGDIVFDGLDVTAEAGGPFRALTKAFTVNVTDGRLDLMFRAVNEAAVVSAIAVVQRR